MAKFNLLIVVKSQLTEQFYLIIKLNYVVLANDYIFKKSNS